MNISAIATSGHKLGRDFILRITHEFIINQVLVHGKLIFAHNWIGLQDFVNTQVLDHLIVDDPHHWTTLFGLGD